MLRKGAAMRVRTRRFVALAAACGAGLLLVGGGACSKGGAAGSLQVERLPDVKPNLPAVPKLPPPPYPVKYGDGSYSVFGLRKKIEDTIDQTVSVTGYIVSIYEPPECPKKKCRAKAPHMWVADARDEQDKSKWLQVVGYAENHKQLREAIEDARRGRYEPPPPESGLLPIPVDFAVGNKVKVTGRFTYVSGAGFASSDGVLEYRSHETLEAVEPAE